MNVGILKYKHYKVLFAIAFLLGLTFTTKAQLVELNVKLLKDTILIGQHTEIQVDINSKKGVFLQPFVLRDSLNKEIEILDSLSNTRKDSVSYRLTITSFAPGAYKISRIPLAFSFENNTDTIFSPELLLTVVSPEIKNQAEIKDIKPPLTLPFRLREILPETSVILGVLLVIAVLIFIILRRLRKKKLAEIAEIKLPAHVQALQALDKLKEEKLWQNGKIKEYHSRLADIVRVYLERRFEIPAMEFVSSETMDAFRKKMPHEDLLIEMLTGILETSDIVKFAKGEPLPPVNQGNMDNAYLFIGQTKIEEITNPLENEEAKVNIETNEKIAEG
jgi:hypothetical protein